VSLLARIKQLRFFSKKLGKWVTQPVPIKRFAKSIARNPRLRELLARSFRKRRRERLIPERALTSYGRETLLLPSTGQVIKGQKYGVRLPSIGLERMSDTGVLDVKTGQFVRSPFMVKGHSWMIHNHPKVPLKKVMGMDIKELKELKKEMRYDLSRMNPRSKEYSLRKMAYNSTRFLVKQQKLQTISQQDLNLSAVTQPKIFDIVVPNKRIVYRY